MSDPRLSAQEEQVRRLLADARHDEPMPDDVAERLDRVLADLRPAGADAGGSEARTSGGTGPGADRAARRRRTLRNLVLAAAAVVVVGVGSTRVDLPGGSGADSAGSADSESAATADAGGSADSADGADTDAPTPERPDDLSNRSVELFGYSGSLPRPIRLTSSSFDRVVRRLAGQDAALSQLSADSAAPPADGLRSTAKAVTGCTNPGWGKGRRIAARYDGARAAVVLRPRRDGARVVDLYLCGESQPVRSTTIVAD